MLVVENEKGILWEKSEQKSPFTCDVVVTSFFLFSLDVTVCFQYIGKSVSGPYGTYAWWSLDD